IAAGTVTMHPRTEMLDLVVIDGKARGIVTRNLQTGAIQSHVGDVVLLATGGYSNVFYLSTNAKAANCHPILRGHRPARAVRDPVLHADSSNLHPAGRRVPVEAHAHVGVAAQRRPHLGSEAEG